MTLAHFDSRNSSEIVSQIPKIGSRASTDWSLFTHAFVSRPCKGRKQQHILCAR